MDNKIKNNDFITLLAEYIWQSKYRFTDGEMVRDKSIQDSWRRVANSLAQVESDSAMWADKFYSALEDFKFLPGGRILAGCGTGKQVTLFNCFVMGKIEDSLESIFEHLKQGALTMQEGGGVGYDFSTLRPKGSIARTTGRIASGPVSFMRIWDAMCDTVLSTGARRGAMLGSLRCDHPDIEAFIDAKKQPGSLTHFNLSVQITDDFMRAVDEDEPWPLVFPAETVREENATGESVMMRWSGAEEPVLCRVFRRISARRLWHRIMRSTYDHGEPGVLFVDHINASNNQWYREHITTTNPCGEIPLPPYGACDLGSINLTRFVYAPFRDDAALDMNGIDETVAIAVRMLDNVIDITHFPLEQQAEQARGSRRIGLGLTGLADALIMLGLHYASSEARALAAQVMERICHQAYRTSIELAREKGSFPYYERDSYMQGLFIRKLPPEIHEGIRHYGIRNSHLTAIAPAGTISLLAGNVSSGIEPVFDLRHSRRVLTLDGDYREFDVVDYAFDLWQRRKGQRKHAPDAFVTAYQLPPGVQLEMQAALQPFVDNAISKTINIPENYPYDAFETLYALAYEKGLKGCTTFRPNPITGELLKGRAAREQLFSSHCCSPEREGE